MRRKSIGRSGGDSEGSGAQEHDRGLRPNRVARNEDSFHRLRVITVTGTSGKTTTAWLTAAVLAEAGLRVGVLSDLGCLGLSDDVPAMSDYARKGKLTRWLARLAESGCTHAVVELSGRAIEAGALAGVRSDTVVITSVAQPALAHHDDDTSLMHTPPPARSCAAAVATLVPGGVLVNGVSRRPLQRLLRALPQDATCVTAGLSDACDVTATPVEAGLFGRMVLAACGGQIVPLTLDPPVVPFVRDSLFALAVGSRYGIPLHLAARGIEAAGCVPGRVERLARGQDAAVFLDMPSSGHALSSTLASLRRLTPGRLAVLVEEPLAKRLGDDEFGSIVARHCDACVLVPATVLSDTAGEREFAAYARIDRLLGSLTGSDSALVLGDSRSGGHPSDAPEMSRFPLATLVDGWLQLAHGLPSTAARGAA